MSLLSPPLFNCLGTKHIFLTPKNYIISPKDALMFFTLRIIHKKFQRSNNLHYNRTPLKTLQLNRIFLDTFQKFLPLVMHFNDLFYLKGCAGAEF